MKVLFLCAIAVLSLTLLAQVASVSAHNITSTYYSDSNCNTVDGTETKVAAVCEETNCGPRRACTGSDWFVYSKSSGKLEVQTFSSSTTCEGSYVVSKSYAVDQCVSSGSSYAIYTVVGYTGDSGAGALEGFSSSMVFALATVAVLSFIMMIA